MTPCDKCGNEIRTDRMIKIMDNFTSYARNKYEENAIEEWYCRTCFIKEFVNHDIS